MSATKSKAEIVGAVIGYTTRGGVTAWAALETSGVLSWLLWWMFATLAIGITVKAVRA